MRRDEVMALPCTVCHFAAHDEKLRQVVEELANDS
jgi:hypothetical protein